MSARVGVVAVNPRQQVRRRVMSDIEALEGRLRHLRQLIGGGHQGLTAKNTREVQVNTSRKQSRHRRPIASVLSMCQPSDQCLDLVAVDEL